MPAPARNLILSLLNRNPAKRLGSGPTDAEEIKNHEFFADLNWDDIAAKKGIVKKPKTRLIITNPKSIRTFFEEEKESMQRFAAFEKANPKLV